MKISLLKETSAIVRENSGEVDELAWLGVAREKIMIVNDTVVLLIILNDTVVLVSWNFIFNHVYFKHVHLLEGCDICWFYGCSNNTTVEFLVFIIFEFSWKKSITNIHVDSMTLLSSSLMNEWNWEILESGFILENFSVPVSIFIVILTLIFQISKCWRPTC